jgi:hypothetical protein
MIGSLSAGKKPESIGLTSIFVVSYGIIALLALAGDKPGFYL